MVVGRRVNSNYRAGVVAYTNPAGTANRGSQITLFISAGPSAQPQPQQPQQPQPPPPDGGGNNGNGNGNGNGGGGPG